MVSFCNTIHSKGGPHPFAVELSKVLESGLLVPVFLGAVLAGCAFHLANNGVGDPDIWWHLRNAEHLVQTHQFIQTELYSYTVSGLPWLNHEWLSELPYYFGWRVAGLQGVFLVMIVLIQAVTISIFYLAYVASGNVKAAFLSCWVAMLLTTVSFGPRMLLFGWLFFVAQLIILWRYREQGIDRLWLLPPLYTLWINCHGSWLIGLTVLGIFIVSGMFELSVGFVEARRWSAEQRRKLIIVAAACFLALFINPYGYRLVFYPFDFAFNQTLNVSNVQEWASVDFHGLSGKILLGAILGTFVITFLRKQKWGLEHLLLFFLAIYSSVTYVRFLFLAGIIFAPIMARRLDMVPHYEPEKDKPLINAAFLLGLVIFMWVRFPSNEVLTRDVEKIFPRNVCGHLQSRLQGQSDRVFNDYLWGGYLILNCRNVPVYIDSRYDIFEHKGILKEYLEAIRLKDSFEIMQKHDIRYVLLSPDSALAYLFRQSPQWQIGYSDNVAVVFERVDQGPVAKK